MTLKDEMYEVCMQIILHSGDAKTSAEEANTHIYDGEFEEAKEILRTAKQQLKEAHKIQSNLIKKEANGEQMDINMLLIHAQQHLSMATMSIEHSEQLLILYKRIDELEHSKEHNPKRHFSILLTCAMGMSTSLLVERMKIAANLQEKTYDIRAVDVDSLDEESDYDVLLVAPQILWDLPQIKHNVPKGVPIVPINRGAYTSLDGAEVLKEAEQAILKGGY